MCLAIPARIVEFLPEEENVALVEVSGVRRRIDIALLEDDPPACGDWVLIHAGFAMSRLDESQAAEQLRLLEMMGESDNP